MTSSIFGKYEILRRLAVGGMGEIFLARQKGVVGFDRFVILKSLLPEFADDREGVAQFLDEARLAATLNHPNIVDIYEVGLWEGVYFIAMEYIEGENVANILKTLVGTPTRIPSPVTARIIYEAALALDYAHRATDASGKPLAIVHRDISPANIMVRKDGLTKVVDFGIAKAEIRSTRTQTGVVKGRVRYMAPEQVRSLPVDGRTDQFSLGVVFWEMCTGRRLFGPDVDIAARFREPPLRRPREVESSTPYEIERIVMNMLESDPRHRYDSCGAVAEALTPFLEAHASASTHEAVADFLTRVVPLPEIKTKPISKPGVENFIIPLKVQSWDEVDSVLAASTHSELNRADDQDPTKPVETTPGPMATSALDSARRVPRLAIWGVGALLLAVLAGALLTLNRAPPPVVQPVVEVSGSVEPIPPPQSHVETPVPPAPPAAAEAQPDAGATAALTRAKKPSGARACNESELTRAFAKRRRLIERCIEASASELPSTSKVSVRFEVDTKGRVLSAALVPPELSPGPLGQCILRVARETKFCRPRSSAAFRIPVELRARRQ